MRNSLIRLTRMLVNAMEVTGIKGNFCMTCNVVMRVLHQNKDSLMAILEACVYALSSTSGWWMVRLH